MRKSKTKSISELLREYVRALRIERKLKETDVISCWEEILGKSVANRTKSLYIKQKVLYVQLKSSVLRNELMMMRTDIKNRLNEKAGEVIIEKIVLR